MDLYIVYSPYHLFITVNLAIHENKNHKGELIVASRSKGINVIARNVLESGLFSKVSVLDEKNLKVFLGNPKRTFLMKAVRRIGRNILNLPFILSQRRYRSMPFYGRQYRNIYIPESGGYLDGFVAKQAKGGAKLFLIEDGVGDRIGENDNMKLMFKIFGWMNAKSFWHFISAGYLFNPEMSVSKPYFPIISQIRPTENDAEAFRKIFQYDPENDPLFDCEFIYFTQYGFGEPSLISEIYSLVESMVIKKHPSSREEYGEVKILESDIPFEVSCAFLDLDEKVFISPNSACMSNPKYIFDKEPYLIFVYKLLPKHVSIINKTSSISEFDEINKRTLIDHYSKPEKIFIPNNIEEFKEAVDKIREMKRLSGNSTTIT